MYASVPSDSRCMVSLGSMNTIPTDFYACQTGRIGRGFFCGTCSSKMLPSAEPVELVDEGTRREHL